MLPISRAKILAYITPFINVGAGALAAWLLVHVQVLGIFHVRQSQVAALVSGGVVFGVTTLLGYLSHHYHWLPLQLVRLKSKAATSVKPGTNAPASGVLSFLMPYIDVAAAALAAWLFVHLHVLGFLHITQGTVAKDIAAAIVFGVSALVVWLGHTYHFLPLTARRV